MSLFDLFSSSPKKEITQAKFEESIQNQALMIPLMIERLRENSITSTTNLPLEFYFYTKSTEKAQALGKALSHLHYKVEYLPCGFLQRTTMITGWSTEMPMHESTILEWIKQMCQLGYDYDCEFDAWESPLEH